MSRHVTTGEIIDALRQSQGRTDVAAAALGCSPQTIRRRGKFTTSIASQLGEAKTQRRHGSPRVHNCVHCGDRATMPGEDGPECTECAIEMATGRVPGMAGITSR